MRMNVFEMEGFLRGRCVPRDLKVNETDAEYLVRKFDALEAKCAAQENKVIPVSTELPPANESVLLFDAIEMVRRYAHLAPNHLTEHARQIDSILNPSVPNLSQSKNKEGTNDV